MESHPDSVTKTRNPVILILYQLLCWAPQGIKARLELHFSRWNKKEDVPLITPVQETSSNNEAQDQAKTPVQETSSFYVIPLVKGGQDDVGDDIAVKEIIKLMKSPDISSTAQEKGSSLEKSPPISTPYDSGHQQPVEHEDLDQSSPGKVPRKAKRRRRSRKRRAEATEMEVAEMPSLHLRDNQWAMLLLQISSKLIRCGVGWQIPAAVIWFLLISNALATPLMNKEQLDKQTARKTDFTQASPQCSTCQIHSFCSRGESLTNQLLFIRIAAKDKYCHFQVRSLPYTGRCTDVSNVTLINATCLHLNTRDLDYKEFNLEYGATSKGESAQSVPAGCCDISTNDHTNPFITTFVISAAVVILVASGIVAIYLCVKRSRDPADGRVPEDERVPEQNEMEQLPHEGNTAEHNGHIPTTDGKISVSNGNSEMEPLKGMKRSNSQRE